MRKMKKSIARLQPALQQLQAYQTEDFYFLTILAATNAPFHLLGILYFCIAPKRSFFLEPIWILKIFRFLRNIYKLNQIPAFPYYG